MFIFCTDKRRILLPIGSAEFATTRKLSPLISKCSHDRAPCVIMCCRTMNRRFFGCQRYTFEYVFPDLFPPKLATTRKDLLSITKYFQWNALLVEMFWNKLYCSSSGSHFQMIDVLPESAVAKNICIIIPPINLAILFRVMDSRWLISIFFTLSQLQAGLCWYYWVNHLMVSITKS